jgi:hypothetical protein
MFGYVVADQPEMKIREYEVYHSFYCGLCRSLKKNHGRISQLTLTYDMTFLVMLLTGLYEPKTMKTTSTCLVHPLRKHTQRYNEYCDYAADMNVLLSYEKCLDDWKDEKKHAGRAMAAMLKGANKKILEKYPQKTEKILENLQAIYQAEEKNELDIDVISGYYGKVMAEIFACHQDVWEETLRRMGFFLGKFIYIMDAFEDVKEDLEKGNYNPLKKSFLEDSLRFQEKCEQILTMMMAECAHEFEKLPILEHVDILRNILYSGVWVRYRKVIRQEGKNELQQEAGE